MHIFCQSLVSGKSREKHASWCTRHMAKPRPQVGSVCQSHHQNTAPFTTTTCDWSLDLRKKKLKKDDKSRRSFTDVGKLSRWNITLYLQTDSHTKLPLVGSLPLRFWCSKFLWQPIQSWKCLLIYNEILSPRSRPCKNWSGICMYGFGEIEPKVWEPSLKTVQSFVPLATREQKWRRRFAGISSFPTRVHSSKSAKRWRS